MENNQTSLNQMHFRHLSAEEIENPFIYINEFCERETRFHYFRQDILDLLKTAYSLEEKFYSSHSPSYGYDQQQLIRVIEAVYVLYIGEYNFSSGRGKVSVEHHECLTSQEVADIGHFLEDFFDYKDLDEWREYLDEILLHAYKEGGVGFFEYDKTPFKTIGLLEKFVEAVFLIHELAPHERIGTAPDTPADEADELERVDGTADNSQSAEKDTAAADEEAQQENHGVSTRAAPAPDEILPEQLSKEVHDFFSLIDPRFIGEGLRHILLNYMREGFETGFGKEDMLAELMYPLQRLFEMFDVARRETSHWSDGRVGSDFVK